MDSIAETAARLDADRREAARAMTFEQRALSGVAMFDLCIAAMRAGIRMQHPGMNDNAVDELVVQRLRMSRRYEAKA